MSVRAFPDKPSRGQNHDRMSLLREALVFGLGAAVFIVYPGPIATVLGQPGTTILTLGFAGLWSLYAIRLLMAGRLAP